MGEEDRMRVTSLKALRHLHWTDIEQVEHDGPSQGFEASHRSANFRAAVSRFEKRKSRKIGNIKLVLLTMLQD